MPKPRTAKTAKKESELLRSTLEKILLHRAGVYLPLRHLDLVTESMERSFDEVLLRVLGLLGVSLELHDPHRGVVELFDHVAQRKTSRFMKSREWTRCRKLKREELKFVDHLPQEAIDAAQQLRTSARPRKPRFTQLTAQERIDRLPCTYR